jgi:hypothetical protein
MAATAGDPGAPRLDLASSVHWIWRHYVMPSGYALFSVGGVKRLVHRVALEASLGRPLHRTEVVVHRCDRRDCVNPAHLRLGSMDHSAQISTDARAFIIQQYIEGVKVSTLAKAYDVTQCTIYRWIRGLGLQQLHRRGRKRSRHALDDRRPAEPGPGDVVAGRHGQQAKQACSSDDAALSPSTKRRRVDA